MTLADVTKPRTKPSFQSIGVTKDWRRRRVHCRYRDLEEEFPINRRHQGLATPRALADSGEFRAGFQSIGVTKDWRQLSASSRQRSLGTFPINRRHQGLATHKLRGSQSREFKFPINRRHQGLATSNLNCGTTRLRPSVSNQ